MLNIDRFYETVFDHWTFQKQKFLSFHFYPFGQTSVDSIVAFTPVPVANRTNYNKAPLVFFYDQEPLDHLRFSAMHNKNNSDEAHIKYNLGAVLLASTDRKGSDLELVKQEFPHVDHWYYFFHAFAARDWFRDFETYSAKDIINNNTLAKDFLCNNRLISGPRSYRMSLVANLLDKNLHKNAFLSCNITEESGTSWIDEIQRTNSMLSDDAKSLITKQFSALQGPLLYDVGSTDAGIPNQSFKINLTECMQSFFQIVPETCYYENRLHLTEKVFKPIVACQPFILASTEGNLNYLKSYGFRTFSDWIDESYDNEPDPDKRMNMIVAEIEKICALSYAQKREMFNDMRSTLEHNNTHFWKNLFEIAWSEMWYNWNVLKEKHGF